MRKALIAGLVLAGALLAAAAANGSPAATSGAAVIPGCSKGSLNLIKSGMLTIGADNPAFPPWFSGPEKKPWKVSDPTNGKGFESAVAYAVARAARLREEPGRVDVRAVQRTRTSRARRRSTSTSQQVSYTPAAREGGRLLERRTTS